MSKKTAARKTAKKTGPPEVAKKTAAEEQKVRRVLRKGSRLSMVRQLIAVWADTLADNPNKSGIAELIRLLSLEKELSESKESVKEIKVTWVEPGTTESSKSE